MVLSMAAELVKIEHLRKQYDDSNVILKDLSLTIHEGEVVVIVGPSGCGKSTLLRCIWNNAPQKANYSTNSIRSPATRHIPLHNASNNYLLERPTQRLPVKVCST